MELDTGSQLTILNRSVLSSVMNVSLTPSDRVIRVANGHLVSNIMQGSVEVSYNMTEFVNKVKLNPIFEDGVGLVKDFQANIQVKEGNTSVYRESRTVALREKVNDDLRL